MLNTISNIKQSVLALCFEENVSNESPIKAMFASGFDNYLQLYIGLGVYLVTFVH